MGGRGSGRSGRSWLYWIARLWDDISAVSKGRSGRRAKRRITGRFLSRLLKVMVMGSLLIPVYEGTSIVPKYYIRKALDGTIRIYDSRQILIPKYVIRRNRIYLPGQPLTPLLQGDPFIKEKGGQIWKKK